jgi:enamine deaminase RidA (YjgF/YER057c/UK114 family)
LRGKDAVGRVENRLRELGITLPEARKPLANYVPAVRSGNLVYTAGQVSASQGREYKGKLGLDLSVEEGREAARVCGTNCLAALLTVLDSLDRVKRIVRVGGFVNSAPGFDQQPAVLNGVSDLLVEVFGDAGRHARAAVGVSELPAGFAVEVELVAEVE